MACAKQRMGGDADVVLILHDSGARNSYCTMSELKKSADCYKNPTTSICKRRSASMEVFVLLYSRTADDIYSRGDTDPAVPVEPPQTGRRCTASKIKVYFLASIRSRRCHKRQHELPRRIPNSKLNLGGNNAYLPFGKSLLHGLGNHLASWPCGRSAARPFG